MDVQRCPDVPFSSLSLPSAPTHISGLMNQTRILTFLLVMLDNALNPNHHRGFKGLNETDNCNICIEHSNTTAWVIYIHIYILFLVLLFHLNISTVKKGSGFEIVENKCIFVHQSSPWLLFQSLFFLDFLLAKSSLFWISLAISILPTPLFRAMHVLWVSTREMFWGKIFKIKEI